jgi:hypothetical protein
MDCVELMKRFVDLKRVIVGYDNVNMSGPIAIVTV